MTAPAAPLDLAIEEARLTLAADYSSAWRGAEKGELRAALDRLLAAIDADRGEAEATLAQIAGDPLNICAGPPEDECLRPLDCPFCIARRYFARREKKGEPNAK